MMKLIQHLDEVQGLSDAEKRALRPVCEQFSFRAPDYYLNLIDWSDPDDPIRRLIVPHPSELGEWGCLDASREKDYTRCRGLQHKYRSTALMLISDACAGQCRYCFRKRIFIEDDANYTTEEFSEALRYIESHTEITNVLLTGGDPLMQSTVVLAEVIRRLRAIPHVRIVRLGTRMPVFYPPRILNDPALLNMIHAYSTPEQRIYIMTHFSHPRELTDLAIRAVGLLQEAGAVLCNQTPLIRGVNDSACVLGTLFDALSFSGITPYYVFQCRPAVGNRSYSVPVEEGYDIFEQARSRVSGLGKRARFVMSHATGKIEVIGKTATHVFLKYHRVADDEDNCVSLLCRRNPQAYWLDDYEEVQRLCPRETRHARPHGVWHDASPAR